MLRWRFVKALAAVEPLMWYTMLRWRFVEALAAVEPLMWSTVSLMQAARLTLLVVPHMMVFLVLPPRLIWWVEPGADTALAHGSGKLSLAASAAVHRKLPWTVRSL
jgi:hypothetical protein